MNPIAHLLAQLCRILVGGLFVFSGLIKVNDIHGFAYKLQEYFGLFQQDFGFPGDFFSGIAFSLATLIAVVEVWLGLWLLLGYISKLTTALLLAMIIFFTALTWYSWFFAAVQDCGCFGDFMKITPYQSFIKDVVLLVLIGFIFVQAGRLWPVLRNKRTMHYLSWLISLIVPVFAWITLSSGPVVDMLGACKGCDFGKNVSEHDAERPIANWASLAPQCETTDEFSGYTLLLVAKKLELLPHQDAALMVRTAQNMAKSKRAQPYLLTASVSANRTAFSEEHKITDLCLVAQDETLLKTIIRCNAGALLLKDGVVIDKWVCSFPSLEDIRTD